MKSGEDRNFAKVRTAILGDLITAQMANNNGFLDITPDGNLSQTLNHFVSIATHQLSFSSEFSSICFKQCLEVLEDNEDEILKQFMEEVIPENIDDVVCTKIGKYCDSEENENLNRSEL